MATGQAGAEIAVDQSPTLNCNHEAPILVPGGRFVDPAAAYGIPGNWIGRAPENGGNSTEFMADVAPCLTGADRHGVAHTLKGEGFDASEDGTGRGVPLLVDTLTSNGDAHSGFRDEKGLSLRGREGGATAELSGDVMPALRASQGGGDKPHAMTGMAVRRLTPRECERLQGMPDDWTLVPNCKGQMADGPRYKMCGNGFARPVVEWIFGRIDGVPR
jgi:site-specific DNA-cytosine methylase